MNSLFRKRVNLLLVVLISWGGLIVYRLYEAMISNREVHLQHLESDSWRIGTIPSLRGRILDKSGKPLAWSIRYFSLHYHIPKDNTQFAEDVPLLNTLLINYDRLNVDTLAGQSVILKTELSPGDILKLRPSIHANNRFQIKSSFRRKYALHEERLVRLIGRTQIMQNIEVGISGLERRYNFRLTGKDGKFRVMVDKNNNWIPATWEEIQTPLPGLDVYVPIEI